MLVHIWTLNLLFFKYLFSFTTKKNFVHYFDKFRHFLHICSSPISSVETMKNNLFKGRNRYYLYKIVLKLITMCMVDLYKIAVFDSPSGLLSISFFIAFHLIKKQKVYDYTKVMHSKTEDLCRKIF